jgi:hypothetical protein
MPSVLLTDMFVLIDRFCGLVFRVRFPALPVFPTSSGSETGSTQPREYN